MLKDWVYWKLSLSSLILKIGHHLNNVEGSCFTAWFSLYMCQKEYVSLSFFCSPLDFCSKGIQDTQGCLKVLGFKSCKFMALKVLENEDGS